MGLFKKKNKSNEYTGYKSGKGRQVPTLTAFDNMAYVIVKDSSDKHLIEIADIVLSGKAVLANFNKISPSEANSMLSFISGLIYATNGKIEKIESKLFLFGTEEEFADGSLDQYIEDSKIC